MMGCIAKGCPNDAGHMCMRSDCPCSYEKTLRKHNADLYDKVKSQQATIDKLVNLSKLIHSDLKMRADEEGVINISNFIWEQLEDLINSVTEGE